jgi:HlyD family secretion protein
MKIHLKIFIYLIISALAFSCGKKTEETKPIRKAITETVFASGVLEANGTYNLTAETDGYLIQLNFVEGDLVREGDVLAVIDNKQNLFNTESAVSLYQIAKQNTYQSAPSLKQASNSSAIAKQKMLQDSMQVARYQKLLDKNSIAKIDFENAVLQYQTSKTNYYNSLENYNQVKQQAEQQLIINEAQKDVNNVMSANNQLRAVVNGKVFQKFKQRGDFVKKGDVIASIGDANFIYAKVNVDESNISKIKVGQTAVIQLNINKNKTYQGKVAEIYPAFDESSQSFTCKIVFDDSLDFKIVNTQLQVNITVRVNPNALLIPRSYLDYGNLVTVKGKKEKVKVETNIVSNEWVEIKSGIQETDILITDKVEGQANTNLRQPGQ